MRVLSIGEQFILVLRGIFSVHCVLFNDGHRYLSSLGSDWRNLPQTAARLTSFLAAGSKRESSLDF